MRRTTRAPEPRPGATDKPARRKRGRPADAAIDAALLEAAHAEFVEHGYHALSMEAIAARAGVSKVSLYRRWENKAAIAGDVFRRMGQEQVAHAESLEGFLRELLGSLRRPDARRRGLLVLRTMGEIAGDPELLALYREHLLAPRMNQIRAVVERARAAGELSSTAPTDVICALIAGPLFLSYLALLVRADVDLADAGGHLVRLLLDALRPAEPEAGRRR